MRLKNKDIVLSKRLNCNHIYYIVRLGHYTQKAKKNPTTTPPTTKNKNKTRRTNNTTIIILSCTQPTQYSFSSDMFSLCDVRVQTACN